jgi:hypothetical protein
LKIEKPRNWELEERERVFLKRVLWGWENEGSILYRKSKNK